MRFGSRWEAQPCLENEGRVLTRLGTVGVAACGPTLGLAGVTLLAFTAQVFSMALPYAALVMNEQKKTETRTSNILSVVREGEIVALHVGQKMWEPKGDDYPQDLLRELSGKSKEEIGELMRLRYHRKGQIVGLVRIGRTYQAKTGNKLAQEGWLPAEQLKTCLKTPLRWWTDIIQVGQRAPDLGSCVRASGWDPSDDSATPSLAR